ncbi:MAG TPA: hypothetical protein VMW79_07860 [Anaerolineae bacterium]|nr:hypothetical protein [Anaerolineae bacterium]
MGILSTSRTSNATKIGQTDNWDRALEEDIAAILGCDTDVTFVNPIFGRHQNDAGVSDSGLGYVNTDGTIAGILRFLASSADPEVAAGVEFESSAGDRYKLCCVGSELNLYSWDSGDEEWDKIASLSSSSETFLGLNDVDIGSDYVDKDGYIIQVVEDGADPLGGHLELVESPAVSGVEYIKDLEDVEDYFGNPDSFLRVNSLGTGTTWVTQAPGSGAEKLAELTDVAGVSDPITASQEGSRLELVNQGSIISPNRKAKAVHPPMALAQLYGTDFNLLSTSNWQDLTWRWGVTGSGNNWTNYAGEFTSSMLIANNTAEIYLPKDRIGVYKIELSLYLKNVVGTGISMQVVNAGTVTGPDFYILQADSMVSVPVAQGTMSLPLTPPITIPVPTWIAHHHVKTSFTCVLVNTVNTQPIIKIQAKLPNIAGITSGINIGNNGWSYTEVFIYRV